MGVRSCTGREGKKDVMKGMKGRRGVVRWQAVGCVIIKIMRIMMCKCMCESESKNENVCE